MRFGRPRALTLAQQRFHLAAHGAGAGQIQGGELVWRVAVRPTPLSREYLIRIVYRMHDVPRVYVETPDLAALAGGRRLPHVYSEEPVRLCLYLPRALQWSDWMRLDQTMIPWSALWFFYFEEWLVSDDWKGGGEHPRPASSRRRRMQRSLA